MVVASAVAVDSRGSVTRAVLLIVGITDEQLVDVIAHNVEHNGLIQEEVMPLTAGEGQILGIIDGAVEGKGGLGQELAGRTACGICSTLSGNLDADVIALVVTIEVAMTEEAISMVIIITGTRYLNHQVAAGIGERRVKIDGPSGYRLVLDRHDSCYSGKTRGNHIAGGASAEVVGGGVAQTYSYGTTAEGDTNTFLGIVRHSGNL